MTTSLKAKLVAATLASVVTITALVFVVNYGASTFGGMALQSRVITTAVRNHTNADMMHHALRADVFAAFELALYSAGADRRSNARPFPTGLTR